MRYALLASGLMAVSAARAEGCAEAWYHRNLIYKQAGYGLRTERAIRTFGNANCRYDAVDDVPLSARDRATIGELQAYERARACFREAGRCALIPCGGRLDRRSDFRRSGPAHTKSRSPSRPL